MSITKVASFFITIFGVILALIYGRDFLMPLIFAFLIWFMVRQIKFVINKVKFFETRFPNWLKNLFSSIIIFSVFFLIATILESSIKSLVKSYSNYQSNIFLIALKINELFNIDAEALLKEFTSSVDIKSVLGSLLTSLTDMLGSTFLIIFYSIFIFLEEINFQKKIDLIFDDEFQLKQFKLVLNEIETSTSKYLGVKTLVSVFTGVLSFIVLYFVGIDSPMFWAFLIFLLNYIPAVGSLVATVFPAIFSLIQFAEFGPFVLILILVGSIQAVIGNIVEPKIMGHSLNLSPLVTILSLSFWGSIWGVTGMLLSVPIMVIIVIVMSKFPKTRPIAVILSDKGKV